MSIKGLGLLRIYQVDLCTLDFSKKTAECPINNIERKHRCTKKVLVLLKIFKRATLCTLRFYTKQPSCRMNNIECKNSSSILLRVRRMVF